jgi:hypothetical protein
VKESKGKHLSEVIDLVIDQPVRNETAFFGLFVFFITKLFSN